MLLGIFGGISKVLGAIYRIPLTHILTSEGMGLYQMVFPLYSLLLALSSSGFPASISKLIAEYNQRGKIQSSKTILKISLCLLFLFSVVCAVFLWIFGSKIAEIQGNEQASELYIAIAPAVVIVGLISGFKGFFQGNEDMVPSSVSMIVEQSAKLFFGLLLAKIFSSLGTGMAALGAVIGVLLSEVITLVFMFVYYIIFNKKCKKSLIIDEKNTNKFYIRQILALSLPITIGSLIMPACMFVDSTLIVNLLQSVGNSVEEATSLFGLASGVVGAIVNMPVVFSLAIGTAIVPLASRTCAEKNKLKTQKHMSLSLVLTFAIILPCSIIMMVFGDWIIDFLYGASLTDVQSSISARLLGFGAFSAISLSLVQVTASFLQGLGKNYVPALSLFVGALFKICLTCLLIPRGVSIFAAEISSAVCYGVAAVINLSIILKNYKFVMKSELMKILSGCVLIFAGSLITKKVILAFASGKIALILSLIAVFVVVLVVYYMMYKKEINNFLSTLQSKRIKKQLNK